MYFKAHTFSKTALVLTTAALFSFTGCDSESSDDSSEGETTNPLLTEKTVITEENAPQVVENAIDNSAQDSAGDLSSMTLASARQSDTGYDLSPKGIAETIFRLSNGAPSISQSKDIKVTGTQECTNGGSFSYTYESTGIAITYANCDYGLVVYDGYIRSQQLEWSGYDTAYSFSTDLTVNMFGVTTKMDGSFEYGFSQDYYNGDKTKITNMTLNTEVTDENGYGTSIAIADFSLAYDGTITPDTLVQSGDLGVEVADANTTESIAFSLDMDIENSEYYDTYNYTFPESGTITVTGAEATSLVILFDGGDSTTDDITVTLGGTQIFSGSYDQFISWIEAQ